MVRLNKTVRLILVAVLVFSMTVMCCACNKGTTDEGKDVVSSQVAEPSKEQPTATEEPVATEEPAETEEPVATEEPAETEEPGDVELSGDYLKEMAQEEIWEIKLSDYFADYKIGDMVTVTMVLESAGAFNGTLGTCIGTDYAWEQTEFASEAGEYTLSWKILPSVDMAQLGIWSTEGGIVGIKSIEIEKEEVEVALDGDYIKVLQMGDNWEMTLSDYNPDYKVGDYVNIEITMESDGDFNGSVGACVGKDYAWQQKEYKYDVAGTYTFSWKVKPSTDMAQLGVWWTGGTGVGVKDVEVTIEQQPIGISGDYIELFTEQGFYEFSPVGENTMFRWGDEIEVSVVFESDGAFNGCLATCEGNRYEWVQKEYSGEEGTTTWTAYLKPSADLVQIGLWWIDGSAVGIKDINVEITHWGPGHKTATSTLTPVVPEVDESAAYTGSITFSDASWWTQKLFSDIDESANYLFTDIIGDVDPASITAIRFVSNTTFIVGYNNTSGGWSQVDGKLAENSYTFTDIATESFTDGGVTHDPAIALALSKGDGVDYTITWYVYTGEVPEEEEDDALYTATMTESGSYNDGKNFKVTDYCEDFAVGDTISVKVNMTGNTDYFNGMIGADDANGTWSQEGKEGGSGSVTWTHEFTNASEYFLVQFWWINAGSITIDSVEVDVVSKGSSSATPAPSTSPEASATPAPSTSPEASVTPAPSTSPEASATPAPTVTLPLVVYSGSTTSGNYGNSITIAAEEFAGLQFDGTEKLVITYTSEDTTAWGVQFKISTSTGATVFADGVSLGNVSAATRYNIVLDSTYATIEEEGLKIEGFNWIITEVKVISNEDPDATITSGVNDSKAVFDLKDYYSDLAEGDVIKVTASVDTVTPVTWNGCLGANDKNLTPNWTTVSFEGNQTKTLEFTVGTGTDGTKTWLNSTFEVQLWYIADESVKLNVYVDVERISQAGATATPTPTPEATATPTPTPEATATPTPTPEATATPTPTPEATATPTPTLEATATPTPTPEATATPTPTPEATATPTSSAIGYEAISDVSGTELLSSNLSVTSWGNDIIVKATTHWDQTGTFDMSQLTSTSYLVVTYQSDSVPKLAVNGAKSDWAEVIADYAVNGVAIFSAQDIISSYGTLDDTYSIMAVATNNDAVFTSVKLVEYTGEVDTAYNAVISLAASETNLISENKTGSDYGTAVTLGNQYWTVDVVYDTSILTENHYFVIEYSGDAPILALQGETVNWAKNSYSYANGSAAVFSCSTMLSTFTNLSDICKINVAANSSNEVTITSIKVVEYPASTN